MKILHAIKTLNSKDGGPTRCIHGLCMSQASLGHEVSIICEESDVAKSAINYTIIQNHGEMNLIDMMDLIRQFDVVHLNGVWPLFNHRITIAAVKCGVPIVVNPHGMLQQWAINTKKWKKRLAWWLYQKRDLLLAKKLVVTADIEANDVLKILPNANVVLLPNGIESQGCAKLQPSKGLRRALFLSRIHEKKGIQDLIPAWCECVNEDWELIVAGPDTDGLWKTIANKYELEKHNIKYVGSIDGKEKAELYRSADVFILPTYSENFGLVVPEALSVGTPVITTTGTPWSNLPSIGCGWYIEPGYEALVVELPKILNKSKNDLFQMGQKGIVYIRNEFSWSQIANKSIDIYKSI